MFLRRSGKSRGDCTLNNAEEICEGTATGLFDFGLVTKEVKPLLRISLEQEVVGSDRLQYKLLSPHLTLTLIAQKFPQQNCMTPLG